MTNPNDRGVYKKMGEITRLRDELSEAQDKITGLQEALRNLTSVSRGGGNALLVGAAPDTKQTKGKHNG